jgi:hypothetical protein
VLVMVVPFSVTVTTDGTRLGASVVAIVDIVGVATSVAGVGAGLRVCVLVWGLVRKSSVLRFSTASMLGYETGTEKTRGGK